MEPINHEMKKRLFDEYGPLSGFAAKIDLAYALKLIPKKIYDTLRIVKKIRDIFAHRSQFIDFENFEVVALLNKLDLNMSFASMKARYMLMLANLHAEIGR
jgi:DNA-binding MltR family transcriptional regulator